MRDLILVVIFIEAFLHYFRWREILSGRELPRPIAYILGVLGLIIPFSIWGWEQGNQQAVITLWIFVFAGGLSVLGCYGIDAIIDLYWGKRHAEQREEQMKKVKDAAPKGS